MKKMTALLLCMGMALGAAACGGAKDTKTTEGATAEAAAPASEASEAGSEEDNAPGVSATTKIGDEIIYDAKDYVTLGDYMGIKVNVEIPPEITDADVEEEMASRLEEAAGSDYQPTDKQVVEEGDFVNIDYVGKKDGEAFQGGTANGYVLEIGSHSFISGFEEGLVGAKVGETLDLNLTFPEEYHSAELAGQDVVFTVTVNEIVEPAAVDIDSLTDDYVSENFGASSVNVWKESVRADLEASRESDIDWDKKEACKEKLRETCTINSMPDGLLEERKKQARETYENQAKANGLDLETLLAFYGMTEEQLDESIEKYIPQETEDEMIELAIAEDLGIDENSDAYKDYVQNIMDTAGYASEDEIYTVYDKAYVVRLFKLEEALNQVAEAAVYE